MLNLADGDSDDDLDKYVPSIITKPREETAVKSNKSKYKGVFPCGRKFKAQIQTGVCTIHIPKVFACHLIIIPNASIFSCVRREPNTIWACLILKTKQPARMMFMQGLVEMMIPMCCDIEWC
jgi:hypothetical protein